MYLTDTKNMNDYNLKLILSILSGLIFSLVIIITAFISPIHIQKNYNIDISKKRDLNLLEEVANEVKK